MEVVDFISELVAEGVRFYCEDGKLKIKANKGVIDKTRYDFIKENKSKIMSLAQNKENTITLNKGEKKEFNELSSIQRRFYALYKINPESCAYNMMSLYKLHGSIDTDRFERAVKNVLNRHSVLKSTFQMLNNVPVCAVENEARINLDKYTVETEKEFDETLDSINSPFNLENAPLLRFGAVKNILTDENFLAFSIHHIISDGISQEILVSEIMKVYKGEGLLDLPIQFFDYVEWEAGPENEKRKNRQKQFWLKQFEDVPSQLDLPFDYKRTQFSSDGNKIDFQISELSTKKLQVLADGCGCSLYNIVLSAFYLFLSKLSNAVDVTLGIAAHGRMHPQVNGLIGPFANTLALRNCINGNETFNEFVRRISLSLYEAQDNQQYPYEELVNDLKLERNTYQNPLFNVFFDYQQQNIHTIRLGEAVLEKRSFCSETSKFDLTLSVEEMHNVLQCGFEYSAQLFKMETVQGFSRYFSTLIENVELEQTVSGISILSKEDKEQLLHQFNDTKTGYLADTDIVSLLKKVIDAYPDSVALEGKAGAYSYSELDRLSDKIASEIATYSPAKGSIIGVLISRSPEFVITIIGILKAGCAYLPLDTDDKKELLQKKLQIASAKLVIAIDAEKFDFLGSFLDIVNYNTALKNENVCYQPVAIVPSDLAYINFTSGTTGDPKAVMVEHRNVTNLCIGLKDIPVRPGDKILQTGATSFDATTFEVFNVLTSGGTVVSYPNENILDVDSFENLIVESGITILWITTGLFHKFSELKPELFETLRCLVVGGEILSLNHIKKVWKQNKNIHILNVYGPTECTTFSTSYVIPPNVGVNVPIGKPIGNALAYVLDKNKELVPVGVEGELYIGGRGVARGYMNDAKLTEEKFIANPFVSGDRLYRSGDIVKWLPDGNIEFIGRKDKQVKIRGFRIELGEIEYLLQSYKPIKACLADIYKPGKEKHIILYYVADAEIPSNKIKEYLLDKIPEYQIPVYYVWLEKFPLSKTGKVDRKKLPQPSIERSDIANCSYTSLENRLLKVWSDVLSVPLEQISTTTSFFEIGGNSINLISLHKILQDQFQLKISIAELFSHRTVERQAKMLEENQA